MRGRKNVNNSVPPVSVGKVIGQEMGEGSIDHMLIGAVQESFRRIERTGHFVEWNETGPLCSSIPAGRRPTAVTARPDWNQTRTLISDVAVDICIDEVLPCDVPLADSSPKLIPIGGFVDPEYSFH